MVKLKMKLQHHPMKKSPTKMTMIVVFVLIEVLAGVDYAGN